MAQAQTKRRILLQSMPKGIRQSHFDGQLAFVIVDATKKTMPVALGYMAYDDNTSTWMLYRIRTNEWIYRKMPKLMAEPIMVWIKAVMTKQYRGVIGYK